MTYKVMRELMQKLIEENETLYIEEALQEEDGTNIVMPVIVGFDDIDNFRQLASQMQSSLESHSINAHVAAIEATKRDNDKYVDVCMIENSPQQIDCCNITMDESEEFYTLVGLAIIEDEPTYTSPMTLNENGENNGLVISVRSQGNNWVAAITNNRTDFWHEHQLHYSIRTIDDIIEWAKNYSCGERCVLRF